MTLAAEWKNYRAQWNQRSKAGVAKLEKPLATFETKFVKGAESAVKAIDSAIAKKDIKALMKSEAGFSKLVLDAKSAATKVVTDLTAQHVAANRLTDVKGSLEILSDRLDTIKKLIAAERVHLQNPGPRLTTDVVPASLFVELRKSPVTRDPKVQAFMSQKQYEARLSTGQVQWQPVTPYLKKFSDVYPKHLATLKALDTLKAAKGTTEMIGTSLNKFFEDLRDQLTDMSTAAHEWASHQEDDMAHAQPPINHRQNASWSLVNDVVVLLAREIDRLERLRTSASKLLPKYIRA